MTVRDRYGVRAVCEHCARVRAKKCVTRYEGGYCICMTVRTTGLRCPVTDGIGRVGMCEQASVPTKGPVYFCICM